MTDDYRLITGVTAKLPGKTEAERKPRKTPTDWEGMFALFLSAQPPPLNEYQRQYRFDPSRKWKMDFAWPAYMVGVELHGGVFATGRHTRGKGFTEDCEKMRAAQLAGWTVLEYTSDDVKLRCKAVLEEISAAIRGMTHDLAKGT